MPSLHWKRNSTALEITSSSTETCTQNHHHGITVFIAATRQICTCISNQQPRQYLHQLRIHHFRIANLHEPAAAGRKSSSAYSNNTFTVRQSSTTLAHPALHLANALAPEHHEHTVVSTTASQFGAATVTRSQGTTVKVKP